MIQVSRNWEESEIYGGPWTYWDMKAYTDKLKQAEKNKELETQEYEKWFVYLPKTHTTYEEAKKYTQEILSMLS